MTKKKILGGVVHSLPADWREVIISTPAVRAAWEDITPLARNEWICWISSAKQRATRERRIKQAKDKLTNGLRRPCCWAGCPHR